jgi:hypothetical protein
VNGARPSAAEPPISFSQVIEVLRRLVDERVRVEVLGGGRSGAGVVLTQTGILAEPVALGASPERLFVFEVGEAAFVVSEPSVRGAWRLGERGIALRLGGVELELELLT